jgi:hypothetical protein
MSKLDEHGLLALHISNNHMEFASLIARSAADLGLLAYVRRDTNVSPRDPDMRTASAVIVLARREADFGPLLRDNEWRKTLPDPAVGAWTDDRSSILAIWRRESVMPPSFCRRFLRVTFSLRRLRQFPARPTPLPAAGN